MSDGSMEPQMVMEEVDAADAGVGKIGSGFPDVGNILRGSCAVCLVVWVGDVGYVPAHWE